MSELLLSASIAASRVPDQKVARNRLLQCVKYRPRLLSVVAWVLCNKGAQLSSSLSRILNAVLAAKAETETGTGTGTGSRSGGVDGSSSSSSCSITLAAEDRRGALTTMLQVGNLRYIM